MAPIPTVGKKPAKPGSPGFVPRVACAACKDAGVAFDFMNPAKRPATMSMKTAMASSTTIILNKSASHRRKWQLVCSMLPTRKPLKSMGKLKRGRPSATKGGPPGKHGMSGSYPPRRSTEMSVRFLIPTRGLPSTWPPPSKKTSPPARRQRLRGRFVLGIRGGKFKTLSNSRRRMGR